MSVGRTADESMRLRLRRLLGHEQEWLRELSHMVATSKSAIANEIRDASEEQQSMLLILIFFQSQKQVPITRTAVSKLTLRAQEQMRAFSFEQLQKLLEGNRRGRVNFLKAFFSAVPWLIATTVVAGAPPTPHTLP